MPMTITEKILAKHAGLNEVHAGELVNAKLDLLLANDVTGPLAVREFEAAGLDRVFDPQKIVFVPDHFVPNKDIASAEQAKILREFALKQGLIYFEVGRGGIEHCLLPEKGLVLPGDLVIGADSHTCTYGALNAFATGVGSTDLAAGMALGESWFKVPATIKISLFGHLNRWVSGKDLILYLIGLIGVDGALYQALEFEGETLKELSMDSRLSMANMAVEAGAKNAIFPADEITKTYLLNRAQRDYTIYESDKGAEYKEEIEIDVSKVKPQVALPHSPANAVNVEEAENIKLDQVVIGSCTNGRLEDLRIAAKILAGNKVHPEVRLIVFPGTQDIYRAALKEGLIEIFVDAGAAVSTPTCGPCLGGHMGILAKGETALSTTNRNFVGRMGHPQAKIYLANPAIAAASALKGYITLPEGGTDNDLSR